MTRVSDPRWSVSNKDGTPMVGAQLRTYNAATNLYANIFADAALTVQLTNPLISNERGLFPQFFVAPGSTLNIQLVAPNGIIVDEVNGLTL